MNARMKKNRGFAFLYFAFFFIHFLHLIFAIGVRQNRAMSTDECCSESSESVLECEMEDCCVDISNDQMQCGGCGKNFCSKHGFICLGCDCAYCFDCRELSMLMGNACDPFDQYCDQCEWKRVGELDLVFCSMCSVYEDRTEFELVPSETGDYSHWIHRKHRY